MIARSSFALSLVLSVAVALIVNCSTAEAQRAVILVRHSERLDNSTDSPLSDIGRARSERLASELKDAGITAIYTSQYRRTIETAEPLAKARGVKPEVVAADEETKLLERLRTVNANDVVLIVGHSNTLPALIKALGAKEVAIADSDYTNLFILIPALAPVLLRLRF
jgi:broad specificity phosphatase PhoE